MTGSAGVVEGCLCVTGTGVWGGARGRLGGVSGLGRGGGGHLAEDLGGGAGVGELRLGAAQPAQLAEVGQLHHPPDAHLPPHTSGTEEAASLTQGARMLQRGAEPIRPPTFPRQARTHTRARAFSHADRHEHAEKGRARAGAHTHSCTHEGGDSLTARRRIADQAHV